MIQAEARGSSFNLQEQSEITQKIDDNAKIRIEQIEATIFKLTPTPQKNGFSAQRMANLLGQVLSLPQLNSNENIHIILDTTQIPDFSIKTNNLLLQEFIKRNRSRKIKQVVVIAPDFFVRFLAYSRYFFTKKVNFSFHHTYTRALERVYSSKSYFHSNIQLQKEDSLKKAYKADKKELLQMYEQLLEENNSIQVHQQQRISELNRIISRLTWDDTFKPKHTEIQNKDPFNNVFRALSILHEDIYEMIQETKTLTLDLETQVRESTQEIAEKEAKLSSVIENTTDLILSVSKQGEVLVINSPCKKYFKNILEKEVSAGTHLQDILSPELIDYWEFRMNRVLQGGAFKEIKQSIIEDNNKIFWELSFNPIRDTRGKVAGVSVFGKNITKQKKIADQIAENEQLLDNIYNTAAIGIALIDENGHLTRVNKTYCHMYGYEEDELLGKSMNMVISPTQKTAVKDDIDHFMNTGKYSSTIRQDVCKNGMPVDVFVTGSRYTGKEGKLFGVFTVVDITEKLKAEETINEKQKALSDAYEIAKLGSWELDIHTEKLTFNPESLGVVGLEAKNKENYYLSIDKFLENLVHPEDVQIIKKQLKKAKQNQGQLNYRDSFEYRVIRSDGKVFNIISHLRYKDHKKGIVFGISQDITDRKKVVVKLKKQNKELKKVNSELDRFVYSVSHDLRSPLTSVMGLIHVIRQEKDLNSIMELLDLQEKSINKLDNFIKDIINLSKNARIGITNEEIHFTEMVQNIFEEQSFNINADKIERSIEIDQTEPFYSDARRISVIFNNLISNAIRYANPQEEHPFVNIFIKVNKDQAEIKVKDNGLGIAKEHHKKIFDMFYRASDTMSGSGLGLYIVKETMDKLKGKIQVHSISREGTEFTLSIPNSRK